MARIGPAGKPASRFGDGWLPGGPASYVRPSEGQGLSGDSIGAIKGDGVVLAGMDRRFESGYLLLRRPLDPTTRYGGTWGHAIHGKVNVTLLDSYEGEGVEGAFVMLRTEPATPYQGLTNADGQMVLSGPGLVGPVTVSAGKDLLETQTVAGFDADNVTLYELPLVPPITEGEGEGPPPRPTGKISGTVDGIDKHLPESRVPEEVRIAYVETTKESIYGSNPAPGPGGELLGDGRFVIASRPGDVALVVWSIRMMTESYTPLWRIVLGGSATVLHLPDVPTLPGFPPGRHVMTFGSGMRPGFSINRWEYGDPSTRGWIAWSSEWD